MEQEIKETKNGYTYSRQWFDFAFENPEKINPSHAAIYFFAIEHCNRLGWKDKFGFPTQLVMDAVGIRKHETYLKYFKDLVDWQFFRLIQKAQNQYSANIISIGHRTQKASDSLKRAILSNECHTEKREGKGDSMGDSMGLRSGDVYGSIDKQVNKETIKQETTGEAFSSSEIISYLNEKTGKQFRANSRKTLDLIKSRRNEGWKQADFIKVIDVKVSDWKDDPKMDQYLCPQTLFSPKFEKYLNQKMIPGKKKNISPASKEIEFEDHTKSLSLCH